MNIKDFNEALYTSSNGVVVARRKNIVLPLLTLVAGVALLVANYLIENGTDANNLKSALVLVGGALVVAGVVLCGVRIFGAGAPYHTVDKCFLVQCQYSFERGQQDTVVKAIESGDKSALENVGESNIAGITAVCSFSPRSKFCAMQAFAYEEFVYQAITPLKITE